MLNPLSSLTDLPIEKKDLFFDMYGTLWNGSSFFSWVPDVLKNLKKQGRRIYILSNATSCGFQFVEKLTNMGFEQGVFYDDFITSGDVLMNRIENGFFEEITQKKTFSFYIVGHNFNQKLVESISSFQTDDLKKADMVYIASLDAGKPPLSLDPFLPDMKKALERKLPVVCANPDYFTLVNGLKIFTGGSLGAWYEQQGGQVFWTGKPYHHIFEFALKKTGALISHAVMIGDMVRTDIVGGNDAGFETVLITQTGMTADFLEKGENLKEFCLSQGGLPDWIMPRIA